VATELSTPVLKVLKSCFKYCPGELSQSFPTPKKFEISGGSAMQFRPLHDRVVVRRIEEDERTRGGIIIPDTAKEKPQQGEVISVGPGARDEKGALQPLDVKAGDRVLFGKWSGTEVKIDGEELLIMKESDILGVLEGAAASKKKAA
jgi:chaperonin GroES